jgi:hypothetical protein
MQDYYHLSDLSCARTGGEQAASHWTIKDATASSIVRTRFLPKNSIASIAGMVLALCCKTLAKYL